MTIFSKIIAGEIPAYKIAEDDKFLAFLDIRPLQRGHTLVIPKTETDYIFDIEDSEYGLGSVDFRKDLGVLFMEEGKGLGIVDKEKKSYYDLHFQKINNYYFAISTLTL